MISRKIILACTISGVLLLSGCGEKEKKKEEATTQTPTAIKVTKNVVKKDTKKEVSKENGGQFYYAYNEEGKSKEAKEIDKYNSETSKTKTTIDAYLNIKSPYERVRITMMIKQLGKDYVLRCSPCHNNYANGVIGPSLLGKDKNFIYKRIMDFKTGKKKNVLMKELVAQIDDKKLEDIAQEIADFNKQIIKMRVKK
jgi:cytochrome c553